MDGDSRPRRPSQPLGADRQVDRGEDDLELAGDVVDDVLDDRSDGLRAVEAGRDPIERLERVEAFAPLGSEHGCAGLGSRRDLEHAGHPCRRDQGHDRTDDELVAQLVFEADPLGDLPVRDQHERGGSWP